VPVAPSLARQVRPTVAAHGAGRVVVAWQEEAAGHPAMVQVAVSEDGGRSFSTVTDVETTGAAQWEPRLAFRPDGGALALVWTDFREGLAAKVRLARSVDGGHTWGTSVRVDAGGEESSRIEGMQAQPTLAWTESALAVAWVDYRERDWQVWAVVAPKGGTSGAVFGNLSTKWTSSSVSRPEGASGPGFLAPEKVSPPSETEVLAADPVLTEGPEGTLVLAWEDLRARRGHRDVRFARWSAGAGWTSLPGLKGGADDEAFVSRFRPSVTRVGEDVRAVFQELSPGKNALYSVTVPPLAGSPTVMPERLDDTGRAANQLTRPRLVSTGTAGLLLFADDQRGWSRIRVSYWP
jgi:hypothetical protein